MAGPGVVDAGAISFDDADDGTARADTLDDVVTGSHDAVKQNNHPTNAPKTIEFYLKAVAGIYLGMTGNSFGSSSEEYGPLLPYLRFNENLGIVATDIPRDEFLSLVSHEDQDLAYVLEHTDLGDFIPQGDVSFNLQIPPQEYQMLERGSTAFNFQSVVRNLSNRFSTLVSIPTPYVLSVFLEHGEMYRNVMSVLCKDPNEQFVRENMGHIVRNGREYTGANIVAKVFSDSAEIRKYVEQTKRREIKPLMQELEHFKADFSRSIPMDGIKPGQMDGLKEMLYGRMKEHNPQLTI